MKLKTPVLAALTGLTIFAGVSAFADDKELTPEAEKAAIEATNMTLDEATALVIEKTGGSNARAEFDSKHGVFEVELTMPDGSEGEYVVDPKNKSVTLEDETDDDHDDDDNHKDHD